MPRRPRRLTQEEAELWRSVARSTRRLGGSEPGSAAADPAAQVSPAPPPTRSRPARVAAPGARPEPVIGFDPAPDPLEAAAAAPPKLDRRRFERMMRGKLAPEARLDLHGMTREAAHAELVGFVLGAQARGLRLVLVITGKGRPDRSDAIVPERQGILRHSLPRWLSAPPLTGRVLEIRPAHPRHGGAGAVYLYLRRRAGGT